MSCYWQKLCIGMHFLNQQPVFMMFSVSHWCVTRLYDIYKLSHSCYRAAYMAVSHVIGFRQCKNVTQYISIVVLSVLIKLLIHLNRPEIHDSDLHYLFWWEIFTCGLAYINQIKAYDQLILLRTQLLDHKVKHALSELKRLPHMSSVTWKKAIHSFQAFNDVKHVTRDGTVTWFYLQLCSVALVLRCYKYKWNIFDMFLIILGIIW